MTLKFILFDMDGTITDTMRLQPFLLKKYMGLKNHSFREVQRSMASVYYKNNFSWFKPKTPIYFAKVFKISVFKMIFYSPFLIFQYWRALKSERLFKDTPRVIKDLKDKGYIVGLATNGTDFEVKIKISSIKHLFDLIVTASDVKHKKPDPEMILVGMKKAGISSANTLYVGDTIVDYLASKNANCEFALVTTGTFGPDVVKIGKDPPKNIFSSLSELKNWIQNT